MQAAVANSLDFARLLFEFRANPNVVNKGDMTALHGAAMRGHLAMMRLLVDHSAALNVQDDAGFTALHHAAHKGKIEVVRFLLDADAAIDLDDKKDRTPAKLALLDKHVPTLELLLRHGGSAHRAAVLPKFNGVAWTEKETTHMNAIRAALEARPAVVHLLADHGGICEKEDLDYQLSVKGYTQALRALRQVGGDAWCSIGVETLFPEQEQERLPHPPSSGW